MIACRNWVLQVLLCTKVIGEIPLRLMTLVLVRVISPILIFCTASTSAAGVTPQNTLSGTGEEAPREKYNLRRAR